MRNADTEPAPEAEGHIVDAAVAEAAGYALPIIISAEAFDDAVSWDGTDLRQAQEARLLNVLAAARLATTAAFGRPGSFVTFAVDRVPNRTQQGATSQSQQTESTILSARVEVASMPLTPCLILSKPESTETTSTRSDKK